jgi:hypothetical protein
VPDGGQDPQAATQEEEAEAEGVAAHRLIGVAQAVERETGIEPATFSLEG